MKITAELLRASRRSWLDSSGPRVGPYWLQWLWTLLFCAALAVGFTVLGFFTFARNGDGAWSNLPGWALWYGKNLVVCITIGSLIHIAFDVLDWALGSGLPGQRRSGGLKRVHVWRPWQRTLFFTGVPLLGTAIGWPIGMWLSGSRAQFGPGSFGLNTIIGTLLLSLVLTVAFHQFFAVKARQIVAEKRVAEARLRLLQAQIEPHFLFNTLANVISLIDHDAPKAKRMLETFTDYLRSSLANLRHEDATLGSELDLAQTYLDLLKTRMEDRLQFSISDDVQLRELRLPPLLLQPLVENAIHHGLEPQVEGGHVRVTARRDGTELVLEVSDDGCGPDAPPRVGRRKGAGLALDNIRSRLLSRYGNAASLQLLAGQPGGTRAIIRLPAELAGSTPQARR